MPVSVDGLACPEMSDLTSSQLALPENIDQTPANDSLVACAHQHYHIAGLRSGRKPRYSIIQRRRTLHRTMRHRQRQILSGQRSIVNFAGRIDRHHQNLIRSTE